jgi:hypothetical protein
MPVYEYYCDSASMTKACLPVRSAAAKTFILS